ncbi:hypothetical protein F01_90137 [Burkholderia cenocepacia]|nr:hypothetical protein F01_90137 [Burkholderia cenocepacia]
MVNIARRHDALCCKKVKRHCGSERAGILPAMSARRAAAAALKGNKGLYLSLMPFN